MAIFPSTCVGGALCQAHGHGAPRKKGCPIGSGSDPTRDLAAYGKNRTQVSEFLVSGTQACKARLHSVSATSLPQVTGNPTEGRAGSYHTHPLAACCQKSRPRQSQPQGPGGGSGQAAQGHCWVSVRHQWGQQGWGQRWLLGGPPGPLAP